MVYIINYFPATGRAESARMLCAEAEIPYENNMLDFQSFSKLKTTICPFGQVPLLTKLGDENFVLAQSMAINRFLGKVSATEGKTNLYPKEVFQQSFADMWADAVADFRSEVYKNKYAKRLREFVKEENFLSFLRRLDAALEGKTYLLGNEICWVDVILFDLIDEISVITDFTGFANVQKFKSTMESRPNLKNYLSHRKHNRYLQGLDG